jgi:hypothetical protein
MSLRFAVITSDKIRSPLRVRRIADKVKVGDKVNGQKVISIFSHEELVAKRRFASTTKRSERGKKELELLAAMMDFVGVMTPSNGTELERLLTSAFNAGAKFTNQ